MKSALRQAYELIRDEKHWCRGYMAVDSNGFQTDYDRDDAAKWCASGAVTRCNCSDEEVAAVARAAKALFPKASHLISGSFGAVVAINDQLGHEAIMQCFEKALVEMEGSL